MAPVMVEPPSRRHWRRGLLRASTQRRSPSDEPSRSRLGEAAGRWTRLWRGPIDRQAPASPVPRTMKAGIREQPELEARQSWTVNAARLAVCAPWIVLVLLGTQPMAVAAYQSVTGGIVLLIGLVVSVVCYQVMLRIGALPRERRVLA